CPFSCRIKRIADVKRSARFKRGYAAETPSSQDGSGQTARVIREWQLIDPAGDETVRHIVKRETASGRSVHQVKKSALRVAVGGPCQIGNGLRPGVSDLVK